MREPETPEYAVYRCYSTDGTLLYIGKTGHLGRRFAAHAGKVWFCQVISIRLEWYPDEPSACEAEVQAIRAERPLYNVAHKVTPMRPSARLGALSRRTTIPGCAKNQPPGPTSHTAPQQPVPDDVRLRLLDLLAQQGVITTRPAAELLQVKRWQITAWLHTLAEENLVEVHGVGRGAHWCAVQPKSRG